MNPPGAAIRLQYHARRIGWQGLTGIALLLACLAFGLGVALPEAERLKRLTLEVEKLREEIPLRKGKWIDRSPQASLNTFYRFLPAENEAVPLLAVLLSIASANGLMPDKASYMLTHSRQALLSRYQINLPVHGSYVEIRKFANQALNALPALALNEISLVRQDINTDEVEANLRFTLFLRRGEQAGAGSHE
ncbi:hypothetical protein MTYP_02564 [Methylophilaceae bacterium]|nr:hypothetical protein MTYP_02564 [Methylophilaceae bacterium]